VPHVVAPVTGTLIEILHKAMHLRMRDFVPGRDESGENKDDRPHDVRLGVGLTLDAPSLRAATPRHGAGAQRDPSFDHASSADAGSLPRTILQGASRPIGC